MMKKKIRNTRSMFLSNNDSICRSHYSNSPEIFSFPMSNSSAPILLPIFFILLCGKQ